uniref:Uncharacterized protein n=1 Tax=Ananas comosus var. bracteatus TaxID=296719 RepID=A0A6V7QS39_ANACO
MLINPNQNLALPSSFDEMALKMLHVVEIMCSMKIRLLAGNEMVSVMNGMVVGRLIADNLMNDEQFPTSIDVSGNTATWGRLGYSIDREGVVVVEGMVVDGDNDDDEDTLGFECHDRRMPNLEPKRAKRISNSAFGASSTCF